MGEYVSGSVSGGHLTDIVNLSRAKDAAVSLALADLNAARRAIFGCAA